MTDTALLVELETDPVPQGHARRLEQFKVVSVPFVDWDKVKIVESSPEFRQIIEELQKQSDGSAEAGPDSGSVEVSQRRSRVTEELSRHGLSVTTESDNLLIAGTVIIQPPYTHHHCDAPNEIVLARIRDLLKSIP